ncbi:MAG: YigZ family protein [Anaerolineaceae bacterium]|nr:YigZ family protein [Anaerolineaceae bacterium]
MPKKEHYQRVQEKVVPSARAQAEIEVQNSRFIATLAPARSVEEARAFIKEISQVYTDASHSVPAFIIGHGKSLISHASDAGEPAGTAGQPALRVLEGSGLGNVVVVVTRYFGGIKLGTGGLVKAYTEAVKAVLQVTPKAVLIPTKDLEVNFPYPLYDSVQKLLTELNGIEMEKEFAEEVRLCFRLKNESYDAFLLALQGLSCGQIKPKLLREDPETAFPSP